MPMIIWGIIFTAIILVSFILALRSMHDYHEIPVHSQVVYSLYLIKNEAGLTEDLLARLNSIINQKRLIISFERLCKGSKKALVVYGPVAILKEFVKELDLIELEDYSLEDQKNGSVLSWEISSKEFKKANTEFLGFTDASKDLSPNEEIWWQLIIQPQCEKRGLQPMFKALIRVAMHSDSDQKNQDIKKEIDKIIKSSDLISLPQAYSSEQIFQFYTERSLPQRLFISEDGHFICSADDIKYLLF